jgi:hypothetical protein
MKITIWPISLDRKCARRPEKINGVLDKQHRKSLPSRERKFWSLRFTNHA